KWSAWPTCATSATASSHNNSSCHWARSKPGSAAAWTSCAAAWPTLHEADTMNLIQNPELLEKLASAYALGTLRGGARRRFETLAREQAPVRAAALIWQSRVASMNE